MTLGWLTLVLLGSMGRSRSADMPVRYWLDSFAFSEGETTLLKEQIQAAGPSRAVLAGEARTSFFTSKGYHSTKKWDVYFGARENCLQVVGRLQPGQRVNCVPGLTALTNKARLVSTLTKYYGSAAFRLIPRSHRLPDEYWAWRETLQPGVRWHFAIDNTLLCTWDLGVIQNTADRLWVLKLNAHRGAGVAVLPQREAAERALDTGPRGEFTYELVQHFVADQYLVRGRRFYVRLWALLTEALPLRAYLFHGGVVVLGAAAEPGKALDPVVNLWAQDRASDVLSLPGFLAHVAKDRGQAASTALWRDMQEVVAATLAAGAASMRVAAADYGAPAGSSFEVVGVDLVVDAALRPWLVEVNAVPSLARQDLRARQGSPASQFDEQKEAVVRALFQLLQALAGSREGAAGPEAAATCSASGVEELRAAQGAGWVPLRAMAVGAGLSEEAAGFARRVGQNVSAASRSAYVASQQARRKVAKWAWWLRWVNPWAYAQYATFEFSLRRVKTLQRLAGWLAWLFRWDVYRGAQAVEARMPALQRPVAAAMRLGDALRQGPRGALPVEEPDREWDRLLAGSGQAL